jgi:hypothetical protein
MDKDEAKETLRANLKGAKRKSAPLLKIAEATRFLINNKEYGSVKKVADAFEISRQMIEAFDKINDQPEQIKKLIAEGKIGVDQSLKLSSVSDPKKRIELAKLVAGLNAKNTRFIIDYSKKHPELSIEEVKKAVAYPTLAQTSAHVVKVHLDSENFDKLITASKKMGLKVEEAGKIAIKEWLSRQD